MRDVSDTTPVQVLLVEDSPTDALLTRTTLEESARFEVSQADRLSAALKLLGAREFDVVLLDLGLPDSQGLDTLRKLREHGVRVPVIVMTGHDDEEFAMHAVQLGAQDYLVKGLVNEGLLRRAIGYAIERAQTAAALRERAMLASLDADVGMAFTRGGSLREMLQACTESMVINLAAGLARIWTLDEFGDWLELQASAGMYTTIDDDYSRVLLGTLMVGRVAESKQPHMTNDLANDPGLSDPTWVEREGVVAFAAYPLLLGDRVMGVMAIFGRKALSETILDVLASIANHVALGIERERTSDALRDANRTLESIFNTAPMAIVVVDVQATVLRWNAMAETLFGWRQDEVVGRLLPIIPDSDADNFRRRLGGEFAGEYPAGVEMRRKRKDGSLVDVTLWAAPLHDAQGLVTAMIGIFVDLTARKQLEEQLRQAQKMEAVGNLAGGVAHDFNNLLTIITGYTEIVRRKLPADSPLLELTHEISGAGDRAAALTRQLLAFSRKQVLEPTVVNLNLLVADLEKMLRRLIGEDIGLTSVLDPSLGTVRADVGQIEQVLMNLVVNARDAMPRGGQITIETANVMLEESYTRTYPDLRPGAYVQVAVADTGMGIDAATRERIFEPFFTTKEVGKGTGLGLSTVYGIIKQSEGHIAVYSEPGHGTTFKIYLPRIDAAAAGASAEGEVGGGLRGDETVLVVEDEPALRALTREILEMQGYTVVEAADGEEAVRVAGRHEGRIDLLVTDVVMPKMGGSRLAERLEQTRPEMKVLYLSGYTDDAVVRHGVLHAETAFLQKPFTPLGLVRKVREVLDQ